MSMPEHRILCCSVITCTKILTVVQIIFGLLLILHAALFIYVFSGSGLVSKLLYFLVAQILLMTCWDVLSILTYRSLRRNEARYLRPHMIFTCCIIIYLAIVMVACFINPLYRATLFGWEYYLGAIIMLLLFLCAEYKCLTWMSVYRHLRFFIDG